MSSIRTRRALAVTVSAGVLLAGAAVTTATPATAAPGFALERLSGTDRYATAAAIARDGFLDADVALLANGQNDDPRTTRNESHFPDALAGSYLSGLRGAPTLLTTEDALPRPTAEALQELGVSTVVIVGGPAAVSLAQEQQLREAGYSVERVAGSNRYATAAAVARATSTTGVGTVGGLRTAVVASGVDFPDALVMGPLAYANTLPLTITDPVRLSPETRAVLTELRIQHVLVAGGDSAVGAGVERELEDLGMTVRRFAGAGRTETARLVAEYAVGDLGFDDRHVDLALGLRFPDALAGGPHAGAQRSPILLTTGIDTLGSAARTYLEDHSSTLTSGHVLGGPGAVTTQVEEEAELAGQGDGTSAPTPAPTSSPSPTSSPTTAPTTAPTTEPTVPAPSGLECSDESADLGEPRTEQTSVAGAPELRTARYKDVPQANAAGTPSSADDFCQVEVEFVFDEAVVGAAPKADRFLLVGFDPLLRLVGHSAVRNADGDVVTVTFGRADDLSTPADERQSVPLQTLTSMSLAVVEHDAVVGLTGTKNPIGDTPIGSATTISSVIGGITHGPDLLTVSPLSETSFAFDFDQPVALLKSSGFHVVTASGKDVGCSSAAASGARVTATCLVPAGDPAARAFVESRSVTDTSSSDLPLANVLQAAPVHGTAGTTDGPDLVRVERTTDAEGKVKPKELAYVFDEPVFVQDEKKFVAYRQSTAELPSDSALRSTDAHIVVAAFLVDVGEDLAGAAVLQGAVVRPATTTVNQPDELPLPGGVDVQRGRTLGPDLIGVEVFNTSDTPTARFTFDEAIAPTVVLSALSLHAADNVRLVCALGSVTPPTKADAGAASPTSVECTRFRHASATKTAAETLSLVATAATGSADDGAVRDQQGKPNPEGAERRVTGTSN